MIARVTTSALGGIKVLDLSRLVPGGLCTLALADLGADVVKVEAPPAGDYARSRAPMYEATEKSAASATFIGLNRNKRSVVLDLKHEKGPETLLHLVTTTDVVVESFRPGVLDRLGVGYAAMQSKNPAVILCSITGWGQSGPMAQVAGHDINYLATVGLLSLTGDVDDDPVIPPFLAADSAGGLFGAFAILAALHERNLSGLGQHVDISMAHAVLAMASMTVSASLATGEVAPRSKGLLSGGVVCYQTYACKDGWVALGALEEKFWTTWCRALDRPNLLGKRYDSCESTTYQEVASIFASRTRAEWAVFAAKYDCCLSVVKGLADVLRTPSAIDLELVQETKRPGSAGTLKAMSLPIRFSRTPADVALRPAPILGEHTREVLSEFGLAAEAVDQLISSGVVG